MELLYLQTYKFDNLIREIIIYKSLPHQQD